MTQSRTRVYSLCAIGTGNLLVICALLISNRAFEQALLGQVSGALTWGPTFFRALLAGHGLALVIAGLVSWKRHKSQPSVDSKTSNSLATNKQTWLTLVVLSVIALGLRLWNLNSDLWYDELISLLDYFRPPMGEIVTSFASQNQHMLYSMLAHASISIFGETAAAVRLPSVLFGVASLWALFLLGRRLLSVRESLLACAVMTVSYHHIWFSQNARGYMGLLLFSTLATWLLLEALKQNTWNLWIGYAVAVALGMWLHMTMAFVVAAHGLIYVGALVVQRWVRTIPPNPDTLTVKLSWKPILAWLLCVTLSLQMHALALPEFFATALHMPSLPSEWSSLWWVVIESLRSLQIGFSGIVIVGCGIALMTAGFVSILRNSPIAALAMVLPALIGGATMLVLDHYLWPRFFFFSMGFAILIAVRGAITLPSLVLNVSGKWNLLARIASHQSRLRMGQLAGIALTCLLIGASMLTLPRLYALPKQDFTGARNWVEQSRSSDDAVVAVGLAGIAYGRYFAPDWSVAQSQAELDAVRSERSNVWLVYILPPQLKAYRTEIWNTIQKDFETVEIFPGTLGGGGVYVCRQRVANQATHASSEHTRAATTNSLQ
jgi:mannosyltransferase